MNLMYGVCVDYELYNSGNSNIPYAVAVTSGRDCYLILSGTEGISNFTAALSQVLFSQKVPLRLLRSSKELLITDVKGSLSLQNP